MSQKGSFLIQVDQRFGIFPNPLEEGSGVLNYARLLACQKVRELNEKEGRLAQAA
jgi:hypothetical protein